MTKVDMVSGLTYRTLATGVAKARMASSEYGCRTIQSQPSDVDGM
jgi:hypothetical protein